MFVIRGKTKEGASLYYAGEGVWFSEKRSAMRYDEATANGIAKRLVYSGRHPVTLFVEVA